MGTRLVTVFGGSGFIGRTVVQRLAATGARVRVAVRRPNEAMFLRPLGNVGQIQTVQANVRHAGSVAAAVQDADAVVNLVGILYERGRQTFEDLHATAPGVIGEAAARAGVKAVVHISAIGADPQSPSRYGQSKAQGEENLRAAFPAATILRPSVVFGPGDSFLTRFANLARFTPALPLIGGGETRFQPVYVGDVADAVLYAIDHEETQGRLFELGGPRVYTFREILECVMAETGRKRALVPLPFGLAKLEAVFLQLLPNPLLTVDQVRQLQVDNVADPELPGIGDLGVTPTSLEAIAPSYLTRFRRGGAVPETGYE